MLTGVYPGVVSRPCVATDKYTLDRANPAGGAYQWHPG